VGENGMIRAAKVKVAESKFSVQEYALNKLPIIKGAERSTLLDKVALACEYDIANGNLIEKIPPATYSTDEINRWLYHRLWNDRKKKETKFGSLIKKAVEAEVSHGGNASLKPLPAMIGAAGNVKPMISPRDDYLLLAHERIVHAAEMKALMAKVQQMELELNSATATTESEKKKYDRTSENLKQARKKIKQLEKDVDNERDRANMLRMQNEMRKQ
jgi:hypothetical protein